MSDQKKRSNPEVEKRALNLQYSFEWGVDLERRIIRVTGDIDSGSFDHLDAALSELEAINKASITLRINSGGGDVYEALAMAGRIQSCKRQIITEGYGHMMSAATVILAAGKKRRMSRYAWFMHHEAAYVVEGDHASIKDEVDQREREENQWAQIMEELTIAPASFWKDIAHKKNAYLTAEECLSLGVIDEII